MKLKKNMQRAVITLSILLIGTSGIPITAYGAETPVTKNAVIRKAAKAVVSNFSTRFLNNTKVNRDFDFTGKISGLKAPQAIKVYIDKTFVTTIKTEENGSFTYKVPITKYKLGTHTIRFDARFKTGKTITISRTVNYTPFMVYGLNNVKENVVYTQKVLLSGWALNYKGIKSVSVFVDNMKTPVGNAKLGIATEEIGEMYSNYKNAGTSGFEYELAVDMAKYKAGNHKIKINILGKDGTLKSQTYNVIFAERKPYYGLDNLKNNFVSKNADIEVNGWFISPDGNEKVRISLDGAEQPDIKLGLDRTDIGEKYVDYATAPKSGFGLLIPVSKVKRGSHSLKIEFLVNDAVVDTKDLNFTVTKPAAKLTVDKPIFSNTTAGKSLTLTGYGVHPAGVSSIQVMVDGQLQPSVGMGLTDEEAAQKYPNYPGSAAAGYIANIDASSWNLSQHEVKVIMYGIDGEVITYNKDMGADGITYAFMDNSLSYYVLKEVNRGKNVISRSGWVKASKDEVQTHLDTLTYMNDPQYKYVFMKLNYFDGITADMLNKVLDGKGILSGKGDVFLAAGKQYNINPIYLVSHALLETGNGKSALAKGIQVTQVQLNKKDPATGTYTLIPVTNPKTVYNMFGIGAYDADPNDFGSSMAFSGGKTLTDYTGDDMTKALNGEFAWDTIDKAITGGAKFIANGYICDNRYTGSAIVKDNITYKGDVKYQQNTLYKMKWDLFSMDNEQFYPHQYATDVMWAKSQTARIKALLDAMGNPDVQYEVPIFVEEVATGSK